MRICPKPYFVIQHSRVLISRYWIKILPKRINVRVEHISHSKCRTDFLDRVKNNDVRKKEARKAGTYAITRRIPKQPRPSQKINIVDNKPEFLTPLP